MTRRHASLALVAAAAVAFGGCSGELLWTAELVDESLRGAVVRIEGRVLVGSCLGSDSVGEVELVEGEAQGLPDGVSSGEFGLAAAAIDASGAMVAAGCVHASVPTDTGTVVVPLRSGGVGFCLVETCNRVDDDCDGAVDEGLDLSSDDENCGYCGNACTLGCEAGRCREEAVQVSAGTAHTCARRRSGHVFCWGNNSNGQLGDGTTYADRQCEDMMSGAEARYCALGNTVRVRAPSIGEDAGLTPSIELTDVVDVDAGRDHVCAVDEDGRALCWGDGAQGRLGNGEAGDRPRATPVAARDGSGLRYAVQVGAGHWPSCARHVDGTISCWGQMGEPVDDSNGSGTVDIQDFIDLGIAPRDRAEPVPSISGASDVDVGYMHACAIVGGQVLCWGTNDFGELGDGMSGRTAARSAPALVPGISDAASLAVGLRHTCIVRTDNTVSCWGRNDYGQLGDGMSHMICVGEDCSPTPVSVTGLDDVVDVSAGNYHNCAARSSGAVACWGTNNRGELGDGTTTASAVPIDVTLETSEFNRAIGVTASMTSNRAHSCAVMDSGNVLCWGSNWLAQTDDMPPVGTQWGRLGNVGAAATELDESLTPIRVSGIP